MITSTASAPPATIVEESRSVKRSVASNQVLRVTTSSEIIDCRQLIFPTIPLFPGDEVIKPLADYLRGYSRAALLFSGGLDSTLLLAAAARVLGPGLTAITFTGPHTVPGEVAAAWALARRFRVNHVVREFNPLDLPEFRHNRLERCYVCKRALITQAWQIAAALGLPILWDGTNVDDLAEVRPGLRALRERGVKSPLLEAGLGKAAIRALSRNLGLDGARPSQSCLATRFPYHTELTKESLARVGQGEAWLRRRGFTRVRLRVQGNQARLELAPEEWPAFLDAAVRGPFTAFLAGQGFKQFSLDGAD
jgi:pyridinium-3,5-biscarboxylic acid mononucleotide sulfurtransferase